MLSDQPGALLAKPVIGVIIRVSHLSIGNPNNSISIPSQPYGVLKYGAIDAVSNVARRPTLCSTTPIGQEPRIRPPHRIARPMAIANDGHARNYIKE
ncbi:MAG: hypothetical protein EBR99_03765 [Actinobacteria bacterium]|nr:hypothetical protein [Actinomycetota bacterium]